jgi:hypothetical protein
MLDHDLDLLPDRVFVKVDERAEEVVGLVPVVPRILLDRLDEAPVCLVGRVVLEDVEDDWKVVTMIVLPDSSASLSWRLVWSMFSTRPAVCSNCRIVR